MALVVALLLVAISGVYTASIPALPDLSLPDVLETSLDSVLDAVGTDKIRRSVMDEVKQLLDTQISALLEDGVKRIAGKKGILKRQLNPKPRSRRLLIRDDNKPIPAEPVSRETTSELIKVLKDGSLQDPADMALRSSVNELLKEDEDKALEQDESNNSEVIIDNDEDSATDENSLSIQDDESDENDFSRDKSQTVSTEKHKHGSSKVHTKDVNHIIIKNSPKNHENVEALENFVDLDEILKSSLKDLSDSSSYEDDLKGGDIDSVNAEISKKPKIKSNKNSRDKTKYSGRKRIHERSREHEEKHKIDYTEDAALDTVKPIQVDETELRASQSKESNDKIKSHNTIGTYFIHEKKIKAEHQADKTPKQRHNESHDGKTHHSKNHHEIHKRIHGNNHHQSNKHYAEDKLHITTARNESKINVKDHKEGDDDKTLHTVKSDLKSHIKKDDKQTTSNDDNHAALISKQSIAENANDKINLPKAINKSDKESYVNEHVSNKKDATKIKTKVTNDHKYGSEETNRISNKENVITKRSDSTNTKQSEEKYTSTEEDHIIEKEKRLTGEKPIFAKQYQTDADNAASDENDSSKAGDSISEESKETSAEHKTDKIKTQVCSLQKDHSVKEKSVQNAESELIHDLIEDEEMKKSYTFTLTFTTK